MRVVVLINVMHAFPRARSKFFKKQMLHTTDMFGRSIGCFFFFLTISNFHVIGDPKGGANPEPFPISRELFFFDVFFLTGGHSDQEGSPKKKATPGWGRGRRPRLDNGLVYTHRCAYVNI